VHNSDRTLKDRRVSIYLFGYVKGQRSRKDHFGCIGNTGFDHRISQESGYKSYLEPDRPYQVQKARRDGGFLRRYEDTGP
jgi:hypothetical protein